MFKNISSLAYLPVDPRQFFAATEAGVFRSADGCANWQPALGGADPAPAITALLVDGESEEQPLVLAGTLGGIFRSTDSGATWAEVALSQPAPLVTALLRSPDGYYYAGTAQDGIFTSTNGGRTWVRWNFGLVDWRVFSLAAAGPANAPVIFAGAETGVFSSKNKGRAWRETGFPLDQGPVIALAAAAGGQVIFAGTESGRLFRSQDQGKTWSVIWESAGSAEVAAVVVCEGEAAVPGKPALDVLLASGSQVLVSRDAGETWQEWNPALHLEADVTALAAPQGLQPGARICLADADCVVQSIGSAAR